MLILQNKDWFDQEGPTIPVAAVLIEEADCFLKLFLLQGCVRACVRTCACVTHAVAACF